MNNVRINKLELLKSSSLSSQQVNSHLSLQLSTHKTSEANILNYFYLILLDAYLMFRSNLTIEQI